MQARDKTEAEEIIDQLKKEDDLTKKQQLQERFWSCVKETPIISQNEDGTYKVIFIYQLKEAAQVKLDCLDLNEKLRDSQGNEKFLEQIPGTDIYYLELDNFPSNTKIPYEFEVNGGRSKPDERNPHSFHPPIYNSEHKKTELDSRTSSILALPESKPQLWSENYIAENKGLIHKTIIIEDQEFGKRPVWIYTPPGFNINNEEPYQLMLVLDGHNYINKLPPALDTMCETNHHLANTVVAIVGNVDPHSVPNRNIDPETLSHREVTELNRKYEYIDKSKKFGEFLTGKILPSLQQDKSLNVSDKPENTYLTGFSMAGHFTAEVGLNHSDKINNIICLSGAFNNKNAEMIEFCKSVDRPDLNVYLSIGNFENRVPDEKAQKEEALANMSRLEANEKMKLALKGRVQSVELEKFPVGHSEMTTLQCIGSGINVIQQQKQLLSKKETSKVNVSSQSIFPTVKEEPSPSNAQNPQTIGPGRKKGGQ